jgi:hypothetical protein
MRGESGPQRKTAGVRSLFLTRPANVSQPAKAGAER